ncbi:unnamed protein product [Pedinophyceae sp. YPF-701]|nr:unnamed protein product [Pedinophyceae sp. YPF-701]
MGSWRLSSKMDAPFARLVGMVEEVWRQELMDDGLGKHRGEAETKFEFFDSADPEGRPSAFEERASPSKGAPGYPRFVVENRFYQSASFRKLHIEAAWRQDGLQVAHIVHYPALSKDVPILCLDMVAFNGTITLAIIDAAPVTMSRSLPDLYRQMMGSLQARHKIDMQRALPEWGREIFSDLCVAGRPADDAQIAGFLRYTVDLAKFHCLAAKRAPHLAATDPRIEDAMRAQERYSRMQLTNEKTRRILEVAMGEEAADAYMREVMFDHEFAARARE